MKQELLHFMRKQKLDDNLMWKDASISQELFVRDTICGNLLKVHGFVVSTHYSKSCELPVYFITMRNGVKLIMRNNFYDWKVSVETPDNQPALPANYLPKDLMSLKMTDGKPQKIPQCYLEGFKKQWCYGGYDPENTARKFTIEVPSKYSLYVIIYLLKHAYPDISILAGTDTRTAEELTKDINTILDNNGHNEFEVNRFAEKNKNEAKSRVMSAWEILWETYKKIEDLKHDEHYNKTEVYDMFPCINESVENYVNVIMKYPEAHEEFLREELMYKSVP